MSLWYVTIFFLETMCVSTLNYHLNVSGMNVRLLGVARRMEIQLISTEIPLGGHMARKR